MESDRLSEQDMKLYKHMLERGYLDVNYHDVAKTLFKALESAYTKLDEMAKNSLPLEGPVTCVVAPPAKEEEEVGVKLWVQKWEETERGWGTRPDGYTLHNKKEDIDKFVADMRKREMEGKPKNYVPDEYSRPCGNPYEAEIKDKALVAKVKKSSNGLWGPGREPPDPPPGIKPGGWTKVGP